VRSQRFVRTSEWVLANIITAYCTNIVVLATVASCLHTSVSTFDVLRRPWMLSILRNVATNHRQTLSRASHGRPDASFGSTSIQLADLLPVLSVGTQGGSARFRVVMNKIHHHPGQVHARCGAPQGSSQTP
jgi:hypothetical protein